MPDKLFRKAKAIAALRGESLKKLITTALERELAARDTTTAHERITADSLAKLEASARPSAAASEAGEHAGFVPPSRIGS